MKPKSSMPVHVTVGTFITQNIRVVLVVAICLLFLAWPRENMNATTTTTTGSTIFQQQAGSSAANHHDDTKCPVFGKRFGIMMDAGSTGSRTHVFEFDFHPDGTIGLLREVFEQVKPGLSSFRDDPEAAAQSIVPLMDAAKKETPAEFSPCTPIALKATAGLRLVGAEKSNKILASVASLIRSYPFDASASDVAVVMDGKDEGPYAWITVNFLLGNLGSQRSGRTAAILDMGGASTQIVFEPDQPAQALANSPTDFLYEGKLLGSHHKLYQNSYLGLGLKEAVKNAAIKAASAAAASSDENSKLAAFQACLPSGFSFVYGGEDKKKKSNKDEGSSGAEKKKKKAISGLEDPKGQDFSTCAKFIGDVLFDTTATCRTPPCSFNGVHQPNLKKTFSGPVYAFSYFYDRMEPFLPPSGLIHVKTYKEIGQRICASSTDTFIPAPSDDDHHDAQKKKGGAAAAAAAVPKEDTYANHNKGTMCADFAYLYALLTNGYGLTDDEPLHIKKKIKGVETAWALGAMISMLK